MEDSANNSHFIGLRDTLVYSALAALINRGNLTSVIVTHDELQAASENGLCVCMRELTGGGIQLTLITHKEADALMMSDGAL